MSIPKEPRQLMINVMYIVLTALLALNVSAAVFNAFEMVEKGLKKANSSLDQANASLPKLIEKRASKKPEYKIYADRAPLAHQYSQEFSDYVESILDTLVDAAGNKDGKIDGGDSIVLNGIKVLKGKRDYDATTRIMAEGPKGMELHDKIREYKDKFLSLINEEDRANYEGKIPLEIDDEAWKHDITPRKNWADFTFNHMPLMSTLPIFRKFQNDAKSSEATVLNYLLKKVGGEEIVLDNFLVMSAPEKSYVIKGDKYVSKIFLGAAASKKVNTKIDIFVNGRRLPTDENGVAKLVMPATTTGKKTYKATIKVTNPVTNEVKTYDETFSYEVGERSVAISPIKMNVFYIGVDNPVEVSASGISSNAMKVSMSGAGGGTISRNADGTYTVRVTKPTKVGEYAYVNVSAPGIEPTKKPFRVKRIPDPIARLGKKMSGFVPSGTFKANKGIIPRLDNFDFEAKCKIIGFRLVRVARRSDPELAKNVGGRYQPKVQKLVNKAKPGDRYFFENVKCKCPGDRAPRDINPLTFTIK